MDTLYTFLDNTTHYETKRVHLLGLMNSATKGLKVVVMFHLEFAWRASGLGCVSMFGFGLRFPSEP